LQSITRQKQSDRKIAARYQLCFLLPVIGDVECPLSQLKLDMIIHGLQAISDPILVYIFPYLR
jgi:hypothetical protein